LSTSDTWTPKLEEEPPGFVIYSDGSSNGRSQGAIGWGYVIIFDGEVIHGGSGGLHVGTNNTAELMGAIEAIEFLVQMPIFKEKGGYSQLTLISDSQYVLGLGNGSYSPGANFELATRIRELCHQYRVITKWVRGHSGDICNEMCDQLAKYGRDCYTPNKVLSRKEARAEKRRTKCKLL
jgi:ribonuclease HI